MAEASGGGDMGEPPSSTAAPVISAKNTRWSPMEQ